MPTDDLKEPNFYDNKGDFWKKYREGRVIIPASFYQRFYDYHVSHGGSFGTLLDVGAGFGELSFELSKKFSHVTLSDPAPQSMNVARDFIRSQVGSDISSRFSFRQERIEDSEAPEASFDAVFSSTALHWMDHEEAVKRMTRQLKPGGTLFLSQAGVLRFNDPEVQRLWWKMLGDAVREKIARTPGSEHTNMRSSAIADIAYDCVALPETVFEPGAVRLKLNAMGEKDAFMFMPDGAGDLKHDSRYESKVGPNDRLEEGEEREWFFEVDIQGVRTIMASYPLNLESQEFKDNLAEIGKFLDGGKCQGRWMVTIIMATKRKDAKVEDE